jgi:hypothetical protein
MEVLRGNSPYLECVHKPNYVFRNFNPNCFNYVAATPPSYELVPFLRSINPDFLFNDGLAKTNFVDWVIVSSYSLSYLKI